MSKTDQITYSELRIESTTRLSEKPLPTCMYISQGAPIRITGCSQAVNCPDTVLAENGNSRNFPLSFSAYVILELLFFCQALSNFVDRLLCLRNGLFFTFSTFFFPKNKKIRVSQNERQQKICWPASSGGNSLRRCLQRRRPNKDKEPHI